MSASLSVVGPIPGMRLQEPAGLMVGVLHRLHDRGHEVLLVPGAVPTQWALPSIAPSLAHDQLLGDCVGYQCVWRTSLGEVQHLDEHSRWCRAQGWLLAAADPDAAVTAGAWLALEAAVVRTTYRYQREFLLRAAALLASNPRDSRSRGATNPGWQRPRRAAG